MILSVLGLGFLIGLQHALEADHVAAVSSLVGRERGVGRLSRHGAFWGLGHTITLLAVGGTALVLKTTISDRLAAGLECLVGVMLVALGAQVLYRLWRDRVHFHAHDHGGGRRHLHAHSHEGETVPHGESDHAHVHPEGLPWRSALVGLTHGMAGSAALVLLTAATLDSPLWGLVYILVFGVGSIVGMAVLSAVIAVPLSYTARSMTWANRGLQLAIGLFTIWLGASLVAETGETLASLI